MLGATVSAILSVEVCVRERNISKLVVLIIIPTFTAAGGMAAALLMFFDSGAGCDNDQARASQPEPGFFRMLLHAILLMVGLIIGVVLICILLMIILKHHQKLREEM